MTSWDDGPDEIIEEEIVEGLWYCPNCNTENAGANMRCGGCGQTREKVDFVYDENATAITDEAELAKAQEGPDWVCNYCSTSNLHHVKRCKQCGADFDGDFRQVQDVPLDDSGQKAEGQEPGPPPKSQTEKPKGCPCNCCSSFLLLFGLMILSSIASWLGIGVSTFEVIERKWTRTISIEASTVETSSAWEGSLPSDGREISRTNLVYRHKKVQVGTKPVPRYVKERRRVDQAFLKGFKVAHKSWKRVIEFEKQSYKKGRAWEGRLPFGAKEISRSREVYDYENIRRSRQVNSRVPYQVPAGYKRELVRVKNLGNGRFKKIYKKTRQYRTEYKNETKTEYYNDRKPIYRNKIKYKLAVWSKSRTLQTTGENENAPQWPEFTLAEKEREKRRKGTYRVRLDSPDGKTRYTHYASSDDEYGTYTLALTDNRPPLIESNEEQKKEAHPFDSVYRKLPRECTIEVEKIFHEPVFEMQPIYRNKIVFEFDKWQKVRTEKARGTDGQVPQWPEVSLAENERMGKRDERYAIKIKEQGGKTVYGYFTKNQSEYAKLKMGTLCRVRTMKSSLVVKKLEILD